MRIRILDRILVAVAGLLMLAICAGLVAQVFFHVDIVGKVARVLTSDGTWAKIAIAAACVLLLLLGGYCVLILFRHRGRRDKFITQKTESGDLAISLKAMETMVLRCLEPRKEIETQSIRLENQRDGLDILIRGTVASGISIPLTVDTLQKQIRQYVTACSGVEVKNIRVQIESSGEEAKNAPFAIDAPAATPLLQGAEKAEKQAEAAEPEKAEKQAESADAEASEKAEEVREAEDPAPQPMISAAESAIAAAENLRKEYEQEIEEEDDRPIHQRLFSTPAEPCIMPLPPEDLGIEKAADDQEADEKAGDEPAKATEDTEPAEPEADETEEEPEWLKAEPEDEPDDDEEVKAAPEEKKADSGKE